VPVLWYMIPSIMTDGGMVLGDWGTVLVEQPPIINASIIITAVRFFIVNSFSCTDA